MGEVIDLQEYRGDNAAYICIHTLDGNAHIFPLTLIQDVIDGKKKITELEDFEIIIRTIISEWFEDFEDE